MLMRVSDERGKTAARREGVSRCRFTRLGADAQVDVRSKDLLGSDCRIVVALMTRETSCSDDKSRWSECDLGRL